MNRTVRILQIVPNMQMGGLETFIMNVYRNIDREKVQFDFLVHYMEVKHFDSEINKMGGKIYRFPLRDNNNIFRYIKEIDSFYKEHNEYKVIHCHMSSIGYINFLIAKKNGIKVRIAHSHNNLTDSTIKGRLKRIMMLPYKYISTLNFACSKSAGEYLYGKKNFEVIPNAIETEKFQYNAIIRKKIRKQLGINDETFVIGHVGRFNVQKNHKFIIKIFEEVLKREQNSYLILAGEGELKEEIHAMVKNEKITDRVKFLGNRNDVNEIYQAFDIFLFPSLFEGLGITLIEAQIAGLKCFTSYGVVAEETKITDNIYFIDLKASAEFWAIQILKNKKYNRRSYLIEGRDNGFEIKELAKKMEERYIDLYMNEVEK